MRFRFSTNGTGEYRVLTALLKQRIMRICLARLTPYARKTKYFRYWSNYEESGGCGASSLANASNSVQFPRRSLIVARSSTICTTLFEASDLWKRSFSKLYPVGDDYASEDLYNPRKLLHRLTEFQRGEVKMVANSAIHLSRCFIRIFVNIASVERARKNVL